MADDNVDEMYLAEDEHCKVSFFLSLPQPRLAHRRASILFQSPTSLVRDDLHRDDHLRNATPCMPCLGLTPNITSRGTISILPSSGRIVHLIGTVLEQSPEFVQRPDHARA